MSGTKCFHPRCAVDPRTGGSVFRINAYGVPGIWACREHIKNTDAPPIPADVDAIAKQFESTVKHDP